MITRLFSFLFLLLSISFYTPAQVIETSSEYQDLFDLYVFKKYEKCLKKALRYQEKDDTRRDAEPYLFASVCYLEIHKNPEKYDPDIARKPLKEALKHGYRFKKRDKLMVLEKMNREHLNELRTAGLKHGLHFMQQEEYRKSAYYLKWTDKAFPEDYATKLVFGMSQMLNRNVYEGKRNVDLAHDLIRERLNNNDNITLESEVDPVMSALLAEVTDYWNEKQNSSKTLQTISLAHLLLGEKSEFWAMVN